MLESLKDYFAKIKKENEFYIIVKDNNNKEIFLQPTSFFTMDFTNFIIKKNYKYDYINLAKLIQKLYMKYLKFLKDVILIKN